MTLKLFHLNPKWPPSHNIEFTIAVLLYLLQTAEIVKYYIDCNPVLHCCTLHMLVPLIVEVHAICHLLQGLLEVVLHDHLALCHLCHLCIKT